MIQRNWWKALGVLLILYSIIAGMLIPLTPGIVEVSPSSIKTGEEVRLEVEGYNSNYVQTEGAIRAWLKMDDDYALVAQEVQIRSDRRLEVVFQIPEYLPIAAKVQDFALILDSEIDGASVLPSAVFVTQSSIDAAKGESLWPKVEISDLNKKEGLTFPFRNILSETIRNTYFHVPLWLAMMLIFLTACVFSIRYLRNSAANWDDQATAFTRVGILFGILGILTGALWAKNTWGAYWSWDVKQNMAAIALLIYLAYFILRNSFEDPERSARISAVYNIFAFATLIPLLYVIPRMTDSLHPGAGGNPAFGSQDLDNTMRMVFYPAVIGWTLLGVWLANLSYRTLRLERQLEEQ